LLFAFKFEAWGFLEAVEKEIEIEIVETVGEETAVAKQ